MNIPPLAIVQARVNSTRLPLKMLLPIGGRPLLRWGYDAAVAHFGAPNVVIACPAGEALLLRGAVPEATFFQFDGDDDDVLGRFHACAHKYRKDPNALIARITPDDWPIQPEREIFTLARLDAAHDQMYKNDKRREHILYALFPERGPSSIDTETDWRAALEKFQDV